MSKTILGIAVMIGGTLLVDYGFRQTARTRSLQKYPSCSEAFWLTSHVGIYRKDTQRYIPLSVGEKGISDIIGCSPTDQFCAIEVKKYGRKPIQDQIAFLNRVRDHGGIAILAYSIDDVMGKV